MLHCINSTKTVKKGVLHADNNNNINFAPTDFQQQIMDKPYEIK